MVIIIIMEQPVLNNSMGINKFVMNKKSFNDTDQCLNY